MLVAIGLVDEYPDIPGLRERWGRDVVHCPYCFGWELRDAPLGILATGPHAAMQALMWRQWSPDVALFVHTAPRPADEQMEQLAARGISVIEGEVTGIEVTSDRLSGVRLRSGQVIPRRALVIGPQFEARHALLDGLGVTVTEHPLGIGHQVQADATGLTAAASVGWPAMPPTSPRASCRQPPPASPPQPRSTPISPPKTPPPRWQPGGPHPQLTQRHQPSAAHRPGRAHPGTPPPRHPALARLAAPPGSPATLKPPWSASEWRCRTSPGQCAAGHFALTALCLAGCPRKTF